MDMNLSKLWKRVKDREAWSAVVYGTAKSQTQLSDSTTATCIHVLICQLEGFRIGLIKLSLHFMYILRLIHFSSVQSLSPVRLFATPRIAARQGSISNTNSRSLPKLMSIESMMPSSHLSLCCPLLFLPPIPPSIRVFSNESMLHMRWPKYWSFSFSISPSNEHPGLISFRMDWLDLLAVQWTLKGLLQHPS